MIHVSEHKRDIGSDTGASSGRLPSTICASLGNIKRSGVLVAASTFGCEDDMWKKREHNFYRTLSLPSISQPLHLGDFLLAVLTPHFKLPGITTLWQRVCKIHLLDNSTGNPPGTFHRAWKSNKKRPNFIQPVEHHVGTQSRLKNEALTMGFRPCLWENSRLPRRMECLHGTKGQRVGWLQSRVSKRLQYCTYAKYKSQKIKIHDHCMQSCTMCAFRFLFLKKNPKCRSKDSLQWAFFTFWNKNKVSCLQQNPIIVMFLGGGKWTTKAHSS